MFTSRKVKIGILSAVISISLLIMLFFVIRSFLQNRNWQEITKDYEVKPQPLTNDDDNLNDDIILGAIDCHQLHSTITIKFTRLTTANFATKKTYQVVFNRDLLEYTFLKLIIRIFPQWQNNKFAFAFNLTNTAVWIDYTNEQKIVSYQWYFKIVSKI